MELIFHERQEGSLCAQHCLNALLQGSFFTAVDLGGISEQLDEQERERMAEGGLMTEEYRRFLNQPSSNMDDSGFFSVQVISKALEIWGLEMIPYGSTVSLAVDARAAPTQQSAFICNFRQHWFSVRKIGSQWFNLNSMLTGPELISETYLSLFLTQLQQEGYSIFIVSGSLPDCEADSVLRFAPAVQSSPPRTLRQQPSEKVKPQSADSSEMDLAMLQAMEASRNEIDDEDSCLQRAMEMSLRSCGASGQAGRASSAVEIPSDNEEESLNRAVALSLAASKSSSGVASDAASSASSGSPASRLSSSNDDSVRARSSDHPPVQHSLSVEDVRRKRLAFLEQKPGHQTQTNGEVDDATGSSSSRLGKEAPEPSSNADSSAQVAEKSRDQMDEEEQLAWALKLSQER